MRHIAVILAVLLAAPAGTFAQGATAAKNAPAPMRYDSRTGAPDAAMVQRVVATLGVGKTVDVTTIGSKNQRTKIQSIDATGFTVARGNTTVVRMIAYSEVTRLKAAGWPIAAKVALIAGGAYGAAWLVYLINLYACGCG